jgi:hypothetical protein
MGVYRVNNEREWPGTIQGILAEVEQIQGLYPAEVMNPGSFIIEQAVTGEEFAVDAYFTSSGEPVVVGIMKHAFSSDQDVSDRVYTTTRPIIEKNLEDFTVFARDLGRLTWVRNFPVHIELRRDEVGKLFPIEVNPLRFVGLSGGDARSRPRCERVPKALSAVQGLLEPLPDLVTG